MPRKTYEAYVTNYVIINNKRHMADGNDQPLILPPAPEKRWSNGKKTPEWEEFCNLRTKYYSLSKVIRSIPVGFEYAHLDCKDGDSIMSKETLVHYGYSTQPKNAAVLIAAKHEYLTKLRALQKEIDNKYGSQMEPESSTEIPSPQLQQQVEAIEKIGETFYEMYYT